MPYSIHYHSDDQLLEGKFEGVYNLVTMRESSAQLTEAIDKYGCLSILNDFRGAKIELSTTEIFNAARKFEFADKRRGIVRAYVYASDAKTFRFFETTSRNNGQSVRVFQNYDEAKIWLLESISVRKPIPVRP